MAIAKLPRIDWNARQAWRAYMQACGGATADFADAWGLNPRTAQRLFNRVIPVPAGMARTVGSGEGDALSPSHRKALLAWADHCDQRKGHTDAA